jgi:acetylornithine deacetylase
VPFGTDASTISLAGVPSVVFGPGSIDQAHTADEWLDVEQLRLASEVLYRFVRGG